MHRFVRSSQCVSSHHLNPSVAAQVEVKLGRVCDGAVHCGASWNVTALPNLQEEVRQVMVKTLYPHAVLHISEE